jgi:signal transduction histidine kinase
MLDTIIRNLLSNSVKFTHPGGEIVLEILYQNERFVEIIISDTGVGMTQECIDALFRIDIKYSQPGTNGEYGSGLGLILCKELVEKNGGTIRVESELHKGSSFVITLPRL